MEVVKTSWFGPLIDFVPERAISLPAVSRVL